MRKGIDKRSLEFKLRKGLRGAVGKGNGSTAGNATYRNMKRARNVPRQVEVARGCVEMR